MTGQEEGPSVVVHVKRMGEGEETLSLKRDEWSCREQGGVAVSLATLARTLLKNMGQLMAGKSRRACCHAYCTERTFA